MIDPLTFPVCDQGAHFLKWPTKAVKRAWRARPPEADPRVDL